MQPAIKQALETLLSESLQQQVQIVSDKSLGGGCINHASKINTSSGAFFVKWNTQGPADIFVQEAASLQALRESGTSLAIPEVLACTAREVASPAYLITDFFDGPESNMGRQDEALGLGIAQLHRCQHARYGFEQDNYCGATLQNNRWNDDWVDFFGQQRIWHLVLMINQKGQWRSTDVHVYEQLLHKLPALIGHRPAPSLNHGDLWAGNYMYTANGPALIDPASYYADRECDLALMAMFGGYSQQVWSAYQEAYPLPHGWKERRDLYMLYHYLNHYYLFGGSYGQQAMRIAKSYV